MASGLPSSTPDVEKEAEKVEIVRPENFAIVEKGVYRTNHFRRKHFNFIKTLKLKSVINVDMQYSQAGDVRAFLNANSITLFPPPEISLLPSHVDGDLPNPEQVEKFVKLVLEFLLDKNNLPATITCQTGFHMTGLICGCLRRLQGWALSSIIQENMLMARTYAYIFNYNHHKIIVGERLRVDQFIEIFDIDLICLPKDIPAWLSFQMRLLEEDDTAASAQDTRYVGTYYYHHQAKEETEGRLSVGAEETPPSLMKNPTAVKTVALAPSLSSSLMHGALSSLPEEDVVEDSQTRASEIMDESHPEFDVNERYSNYAHQMHCPLVSAKVNLKKYSFVEDDGDDD